MIKNFLLNILLTLVWIALTGQLNYANFLFGFVIGFGILWLLVRRTDKEEDKGYFYKAPRVLSFAVFFLYDMIKANIEVTYEIMLTKFKMKTGIIEYTHVLKSYFETSILTNLIDISYE